MLLKGIYDLLKIINNVFETKDPITKLTIASTKPLMPTNRIIKFKTFVLPN